MGVACSARGCGKQKGWGVVSGQSHLGRFGGHLDPSLKDGDGEVGMGTAAQPQTKIGMWALNLQSKGIRNIRYPGHITRGNISTSQAN